MLVGDRARFARRLGDAALRLLQSELLDQRLEAIAVLGEIDGVGRSAEDRHAGLFQRAASFSGVCPPNCTMTPLSVPRLRSRCR